MARHGKSIATQSEGKAGKKYQPVSGRVCSVAKFVEAIYVLHVFEKRTRTTSQHDVELARQRYQALVA